MEYHDVIDKYYPPGTLRRVIYMRHCSQVADLAVKIASAKALPIPRHVVYEAGMLHDVGICLTSAPDIGCDGDAPYIMHGVLGAKLLVEEGIGEPYAGVAERHTGAGITREDIINQSLPLPIRDYMPESLLERLICYADKFYSKGSSMERKPLTAVLHSMERISRSTLERFIELHNEFS